MVEPLEFPDQELVNKFLPPRVPYATLHPSKPVTMGAFAMSDYFTEIMKAKDEALKILKRQFLPSGTNGPKCSDAATNRWKHTNPKARTS